MIGCIIFCAAALILFVDCPLPSNLPSFSATSPFCLLDCKSLSSCFSPSILVVKSVDITDAMSIRILFDSIRSAFVFCTPLVPKSLSLFIFLASISALISLKDFFDFLLFAALTSPPLSTCSFRLRNRVSSCKSMSLVTFIFGFDLTATMIYFVVVLNFPHQYIVSIE